MLLPHSPCLIPCTFIFSVLSLLYFPQCSLSLLPPSSFLFVLSLPINLFLPCPSFSHSSGSPCSLIFSFSFSLLPYHLMLSFTVPYVFSVIPNYLLYLILTESSSLSSCFSLLSAIFYYPFAFILPFLASFVSSFLVCISSPIHLILQFLPFPSTLASSSSSSEETRVGGRDVWPG